MRVLLTGASGFLEKNLLSCLKVCDVTIDTYTREKSIKDLQGPIWHKTVIKFCSRCIFLPVHSSINTKKLRSKSIRI